MESNTHILSYQKLLSILLLLFLLTGVTIGVSFFDFGIFNIWIALLIAALKVSFVLLYFMHLKYEHPFFIYAFLITVMFVAIFIGFMFWDVYFRTLG